MLKNNFKVQKKYLAFGVIVPMLLATAFIKVPCPVCKGTGNISSTGMENVTIVSESFTLKTTGDVHGCVEYRAYVYDVVLTLKNASIDSNIPDKDAMGYVMLGLVDSKDSKLLATQYSVVVVPKNAQNTVAFTTTFTTSLDSPAATNVTAETVNTTKLCPVCGGTGKISLNRLPLVNLMNKSFTAGQQIDLPNLSPIGADSPWDTSNPLDT
jgi:hypothetical protein